MSRDPFQDIYFFSNQSENTGKYPAETTDAVQHRHQNMVLYPEKADELCNKRCINIAVCWLLQNKELVTCSRKR